MIPLERPPWSHFLGSIHDDGHQRETIMSDELLTVGDAWRLAGARSPRDLSVLFYERTLRDDLCPVVGGRRLIPRSYIPEVTRALKRRGWFVQGETSRA